MDKRFAAILIAVVAVIAGIFILTRDRQTSNGGSSETSNATTSSHSLGAGTTGVEIIEYGDFQCPACGQFYAIVEQVIEKYGEQIKFTFKNFPLDGVHKNARAAHRAAEAAGIQGKFFEMYRLVYQNQINWENLSNPVTVFEDYAAQLGLNLDKFKSDFASDTVNATINADVQDGKTKYRVDSTPTFILNGEKLSNGDISSVEAFSAKIDTLIAASSSQNQANE